MLAALDKVAAKAKSRSMIIFFTAVHAGVLVKGKENDSSYNNFFPLVLSMVKEKKKF